jgi:aarF domain-containing kinase
MCVPCFRAYRGWPARADLLPQFQREAHALQQVADAVERAPFARAVTVPRPIRELCRKEVLVMEYLPGTKLVDALRARATALAASRGMTLAQLRDEWAASSAAAGGEGGLPTAPRATPAWRRIALRAALAAADAAHNAPLRLRNAAARVVGRRLTPLRATPLPVDIESVLALLADVHARQIFVDGLFNGDWCASSLLMLCLCFALHAASDASSASSSATLATCSCFLTAAWA